MLDCLTADSFPLPSCRKVKAAVRPYPRAGLSQNITFRPALEIAYRLVGLWSMTILMGTAISTVTSTMTTTTTTFINKAREVTGVDLDFENRMV